MQQFACGHFAGSAHSRKCFEFGGFVPQLTDEGYRSRGIVLRYVRGDFVNSAKGFFGPLNRHILQTPRLPPQASQTLLHLPLPCPHGYLESARIRGGRTH